MKKKRKLELDRKITIRVPAKLYKQIQVGCELIDVDTPSAFIRVAIRTFMVGFGFKVK